MKTVHDIVPYKNTLKLHLLKKKALRWALGFIQAACKDVYIKKELELLPLNTTIILSPFGHEPCLQFTRSPDGLSMTNDRLETIQSIRLYFKSLSTAEDFFFGYASVMDAFWGRQLILDGPETLCLSFIRCLNHYSSKGKSVRLWSLSGLKAVSYTHL
ncbi:MAG: hypothetical protein N2376_07550, partial [Clostridia bacterium]|nr:hypothetical protein [Clostridia bacterium]